MARAVHQADLADLLEEIEGDLGRARELVGRALELVTKLERRDS